jgi:nucleotide-binding universal stress UspA family protein
MKVLIATDGSEFSRAAVERCCFMFDESENTQVRIISATVPVTPGVSTQALPAGLYADLQQAADRQAREAVSEAEAEVRRHPNLTADLSTAIVSGPPKQAIVEEARRWGADVIVLGSHGYGFWSRALVGSVSDAVLREAPCSVLIVRQT